MKTPRPIRLHTLLTIYLGISMGLLCFGLLAWTYSTSLEAVDEQMSTSFRQRHAIVRGIFNSSIQEVLFRLDELRQNPSFQEAIAEGNIKGIHALASLSYGTPESALDLLVVVDNEGSVILDGSSPLFETQGMTKQFDSMWDPRHAAGRIVVFSLQEKSLVAVACAMRIVDKKTGRVMGSLVGGPVLNDNFPFMELIQERAQVKEVALFFQENVVASSALTKSGITQTLEKVVGENSPNELFVGKGVVASYQELSVLGSTFPLKVCLSDGGEVWSQLAKSFLKKMGTLIVTCVLVILLNILLLRRIIGESLKSMMASIHDISKGGKDFNYQPGRIKEFNTIGQAVGSMVNNLRIADESLDESERKFKAIFNQAFQFIGILDVEGRMLETNQASLDTIGSDMDSIRGKYFWETPWWRHDPEEAERVRQAVMQAREGLFVRMESTYLNLREELRYVDFSVKPVFGKDGRISALLPEGRDITERKVVQQQMISLRLLLQNILDSMPSIIVGVDIDHKITLWNREAENRTGVKAQDAQGRNLEETLPDFSMLPDSVKNALETRKIVKTQSVVVISKDKVQFFDCTVFPLTENEVHGAVVRLDEVTDRVQMEHSMVNAEKMVSLGGLAAGMAHEINNPLAGMIQNAQVISNRISTKLQRNQEIAREIGTDMETIARYMETRGIFKMFAAIMESGNRAAAIIDNMLVFAKDTSSSFQLQDLATLLERSIMLAGADFGVKTLIEFNKIRIDKDFAENIPRVPCDPGGMQQVFLNLLKNAAQALASDPETRENGTIRIKLRKERNMVRIEVGDNGPGMTEEVSKRVLEPFYTTRPIGAGTGLGLSVSYFIITKDHAGEFQIESSPGKGTTVIIRLPLVGKMALPMEGAGG